MINNFNELLEEYKDARRNAFVTALTLNSSGRKIAGIFGTNIPKEIIWAMDIVPINIYSNDGSNIEAAEKVLQKENCSLINASYGYAITNKCPLTHFSDIVVGNDMCINKLSMLSKLSDLKKTYILHEHNDVDNMVLEYKEFATYFEKEFNVEININKLTYAIKITNEINIKMQELFKLFISKSNLINIEDLYNIIYGSQFILDLDERYEKLSAITESIKIGISDNDINLNDNAKIKRILICGAPIAGLIEKILKPLSKRSEVISILAPSSCEEESLFIADVSKDPYIALAEKYLSSQNPNCLQDKYDFDAIINVNLKGCNVLPHTYKNQEKPQLLIITDYISDDNEKVLQELNNFINNL